MGNWSFFREGLVLVKVAQLYPTLCDPTDCSLPGSSSPWDASGKNTGVGSHFLLQGIFSTQELNPGLVHCRWTLYYLSHWGSPLHISQSRPRNLWNGKGNQPCRKHIPSLEELCGWTTRESTNQVENATCS